MDLVGRLSKKISADSSGAHMSEKFPTRSDDRGSRLILVPREARNPMGTVERLHAVRRQQLRKLDDAEDATITVSEAINRSAMQRDGLPNIHGTSLSDLVCLVQRPTCQVFLVNLTACNQMAQQPRNDNHIFVMLRSQSESAIRRALLAIARADHTPSDLLLAHGQ